LGHDLTVDAVSNDGLIEAFTVDGAQGFNLSVQWHPEWKPGPRSTSTSLFNYFGNACKVFAKKP
jgi:putative glutamine amidotransferase